MTASEQDSTIVETQEEADQNAVTIDKENKEQEQERADDNEEFEVPNIEEEQDEDGWVVL